MAGSRAFNFVSFLLSTNALGADCNLMGCTYRELSGGFYCLKCLLLRQLYRIVQFTSSGIVVCLWNLIK